MARELCTEAGCWLTWRFELDRGRRRTERFTLLAVQLSGTELDLLDHFLTDDVEPPRKWRIPDGTRLEPGGYLMVWAEEDGTAPMGLHANFKLADSGEQVLLFDTDAHQNRPLDGIEYDLQLPDRSFSRRSHEPDNWGVLLPTPSGDNE